MSTASRISSTSHASPQLAAELWTSFASLLRSHVAMYAIARPEARLRTISGSNPTGVVELLGAKGKLVVLQPDAASRGAIEFRPEATELPDEYSTFFFTVESSIYLENLSNSMDMEAVVEYLLGKVHV